LWDIAKACYTSADGSYHEAISHLGDTHLVCGQFIAATRRQLLPNHPLSKLLLPHLAGTALINGAAAAVLINDNGIVDRLTAPDIADSLKLVKIKVCANNVYNNNFELMYDVLMLTAGAR
jgi:arachidonate 15-lipoxygenase